MADIALTFGAWEPDVAPHMAPSLSRAINVLPVAGSYAPFPSPFQINGTTLPDVARGLFAGILPNGDPLVYGATAQQIYEIGNGFVTQRYDAGAISPDNWCFTFFAGRVIATNPGVSPLGALPGASFAALGGTPPPARICAVVEQNFLVLGNLINDGIDGYQPNRIRWSGFRNPNTWGTSVATQADFQPMPDLGGPVVAITGRETGTVFQRRIISRMQYVGGSSVFQFTVVEEGRGAISNGAVCDIGNLVFFIADDGFFVWDGTQATPIGAGKVDRWFNQQVNHNAIDRIVSAYDPVSRCVLWAFPEAGQKRPTRIIAYSLADNRFTTINIAVDQLASSSSLPTTLEQMPPPDMFSGSFDDAAFAGRLPILAGIDATNTYATFSGSALASTIETGDYQSDADTRSFVSAVRPLIDTDGAAISVGIRNQRTADPLVWDAPTTMGVDGRCPQRRNSRYLRYRQTTPAGAGWTRSVGLELSLRKGGRR